MEKTAQKKRKKNTDTSGVLYIAQSAYRSNVACAHTHTPGDRNVQTRNAMWFISRTRNFNALGESRALLVQSRRIEDRNRVHERGTLVGNYP